MENPNKLLDKFDYVALLATLSLIAIGLVAIYSATNNHPTASGSFQKQLYTAILAIAVLFVIYFIPYKTFRFIAVPAFVFSILLLLSVLFFGKTVYGAKSWINLGPIGFQPSEFAKIGLILFLAHFLARQRKNPNNLKDFLLIALYSSIPLVLILLQPDMGTAIVYGAIISTMLFWSGVDLFWFFLLLSPVIIVFASLFGIAAFVLAMLVVFVILIYFKRNIFVNASIVVMNMAAAYLFDYGMRFLQPHQQKRIETFVNPMADPLGAGYNVLQAKVAIGSGGFFGKGFLQGNQTQLKYIPEQWTDFIYCVIGEEFGFLGSALVIVLFIILFYRLIHIATHTRNKFGSLVVIGTLSLLLTHFAINAGMNLGVAPVIGLPLPFLSYGGSSLLVNMVLIGLALNYHKSRRQQI